MPMLLLLSCLLLSISAAASNDGWLQFERSQQAVKKFNFDVTFVQMRSNQLNTFRWLHGVHQASGSLPVQTELEQLIPQDLVGADTFRRNDRVYYSSLGNSLLVTVNQSIKELPAILFQSQSNIMKLYDAVPGSSTSLSGRTAQLLRLTALNNGRFSYWLWLDGETGFPLRVDTVDQNNEVLERWMVVHMQLKPTVPQELISLLTAELPTEPLQFPQAEPQQQVDFQLGWLPDGYQPVLEQQMPVSQNNSVLASWLLTDGLHQVSVFVQATAGLPAQAFRDGATTLFVLPKQNIDVTVIGPLDVTVANRLADSVH